jgi:hypothetical protein
MCLITAQYGSEKKQIEKHAEELQDQIENEFQGKLLHESNRVLDYVLEMKYLCTIFSIKSFIFLGTIC